MPQKNECSNIKNLKGFLLFILLSLSTFFIANEIYAADDFKSIMQLIEKGEKEKAAQQIDQYLKANPNDPQVIFIKGVVKAELGKYNEAIQAFTYLTEKHPSLPEPFNNLAVLYAELGDYDKAQKALESAIKTHPSYSTAHVNLGDLYTKRATVAYNKALEIDKTNVQAKTKLSLIKKLFNANDIKAPVAPISQPVQIATNDVIKKPVAAQTQAAIPPAPTSNAQPPKNLPQEMPSTKNNTANNSDSEIESFVTEWAEAWSSKNITSYLAKYSPNFKTPKGESFSDWQESRRNRIIGKDIITIEVSGTNISSKGNSFAQVTFKQKYTSNKLSQISSKTLILRKEGSAWFIEQEYSGKQ
ncbi:MULTISPECIES: L,D-transpeptidase Cds6 family protein [Candidatus Methylopumilus]|uniref:L,D-transpeptidase Cds6 family protein n=1 Tax=Candidatus Methylopumilus TaxID=1679002 RepID=UPI001122A2F7|nr:tetratricopeptide repeat protein [Candidatus Methylopumilus planktonicus]QDC99951.1 tetratricopeptide repeat protein [Candidatus Methylopumilus planktonicus]